MPFLFGKGRQDCYLPVVFASTGASTGRNPVPNGVRHTYPNMDLGTLGWQCLQQSAFTTPVGSQAQYSLFQLDTNVNVYNDFAAFDNNAGIKFGDGDYYLDWQPYSASVSPSQPLRLNIPTAETFASLPYHSFISSGGSSGRGCPSGYSIVGGTNVGRYSLGLVIETSISVAPFLKFYYYFSDWFDIAPTLSPITHFQIYPYTENGVKIVYEGATEGGYLEKSYNGGTTWVPVVTSIRPGDRYFRLNDGYYPVAGPYGGVVPDTVGYWSSAPSQFDPYAIQNGIHPIYRISNVATVSGVSYLSNPTNLPSTYPGMSLTAWLKRPKYLRL